MPNSNLNIIYPDISNMYNSSQSRNNKLSQVFNFVLIDHQKLNIKKCNFTFEDLFVHFNEPK
jgi:hypothetical protein